MVLTSRSLYVLLSFLSFINLSILENESLISGQPSSYNIPCAVRKDISPCTCYNTVKPIWKKVECQQMTSFAQIIAALRNKFDSSTEIQLAIGYSNLEDLSQKKFKEIMSPINLISLHQNEMGSNLSQHTFEGIDTVTTLTLVDSKIDQFPGTIFEHMPNVEIITIERTFIKSLSPADFKSLKKLRFLVIKKSNLTFIESDTFPPTLKRINLSDNNITTLNNTLRNNTYLEWIVLARNGITSLEGQLLDFEPNPKVSFLDISSNKLTSVPKNFKNFIGLGVLLVAMNKLTSLDNVLKNMHKLTDLDITRNSITMLSRHEFEECISLANLNLSFNKISNLNRTLLPLKSLNLANITYNELTEFSIEEVIGLTNLEFLDLSFNKLSKFIGKTENETVLPETRISQLYLQFNALEILEGSLAEVRGLIHLNMSHNKLQIIPTEFLNGMQELQTLDVSYNLLLTLQDIAKARLPSMGHFHAMFNEITELKEELDFGFTAVCFMDLKYNKIEYLATNFTEKNHCIYKLGLNYPLYVYLQGNDVLCKGDIKDIVQSIESKITTKIEGTCSDVQNTLIEYGVPGNNNETSPIIVTLDAKPS